MQQALDYWSDQTKETFQEELIVVGSSAGALGVINHMRNILDKSRSSHVQELSIILDSSPLNVKDLYDEVANNVAIVEYVDSYVNESVHPMCFKTDEEGTPCCLSTHCMLRNDHVIAQWSKQAYSQERESQRMLLINSVYDPFECQGL